MIELLVSNRARHKIFYLIVSYFYDDLFPCFTLQKGDCVVTQQTQIHQVVQARYAAIASSAQNSCCSSGTACCSDPCGVSLYDEQTLAGLLLDVTALSLGCGDPVAIANLRLGETVLDLGSGGGIDCFLAARQVGEHGHVIGVDMTLAMLEKANSNKAKMGVTNVEFRQGQIEALPVADNSVDVILSNCVINLAPDKARVFEEAFRVLKPGGRLSVSDIVTEGDFSEELRSDAARWAECVTGAIDADVYLGMIRRAGFEDVQITDKVDAETIVTRQEGMPRLFSARITATKPS
jgi:SAM-dependent methyltransferase